MIKTKLFLAAAAAALAVACSAPQPAPETNAPPAGEAAAPAEAASLLSREGPVALAAQGAAEAAALTLTRIVHEAPADSGQDAHIIVRLEQDATRFVELHEGNHTPFDITAQAAGGVLATAIGAGTAAPVFYRVEQSEGAPFVCAPEGPTAVALYEDAGALVMVGLTISSFEGSESEAGITLSPLPEGAVCGRATYAAAP